MFCQVTNFDQQVIICQGSSETGKTEVIQLLTHYFLSKGIIFLISAASNNVVNINAFKFLKHFTNQDESTQSIYCIMSDVFKSIYSISIFNVHNDDGNTDDNINVNIYDVAVLNIAF